MPRRAVVEEKKFVSEETVSVTISKRMEAALPKGIFTNNWNYELFSRLFWTLL